MKILNTLVELLFKILIAVVTGALYLVFGILKALFAGAASAPSKPADSPSRSLSPLAYCKDFDYFKAGGLPTELGTLDK